MKTLLITSLLLSFKLFAANPGPHFSAFTSNNKLFVTVLADSCNELTADLVVNDKCRADRLVKTFAPICGATLQINSTRMGCREIGVPRVLVVDLAESKVAPESDTLVLTYGRTTIPVTINK